MRELSIREALNEALAEEMEQDDRVFLMGEEVGYYDGAYKVSRGLLKRFGAERVVDTPIAENGFAGVGVGAAMTGLRPVIEFMTFNFSLIGIDQVINSAAKIRYMSGGQFTFPIVFRGPSGAVMQLAAQHSHSIESFYSHCPGLKVVMPSNPADAKGLLKSAIRDENPVVFMESEAMYGMKGPVPEEEYLIPIGISETKRPGSDVTLICWSKSVPGCLQAAEALAESNISAEVIDLRTIRPWDEEAVFDRSSEPIAPSSFRKPGRRRALEAGFHTASSKSSSTISTLRYMLFQDVIAPTLMRRPSKKRCPHHKKRSSPPFSE